MQDWELAETAAKVGALLGKPLDLTRGGRGGMWLGSEGDGLHLYEPSNRPGRIDISGWFPFTRCSFGKGERLHITVAATRSPASIAADITTRLLPGYRAALVKMREYDAREQSEQANRARLAAYITGLFPEGKTWTPGHCQSDSRTEITVSLPGYRGGTVKFYRDGGEVEFERFRVPAAVALRMLDTVALLVPTEETA